MQEFRRHNEMRRRDACALDRPSRSAGYPDYKRGIRLKPSTSPPPARLAGLLGLIGLAAGMFAEFNLRGLIAPGDSTATMSRILGSEALYRLGFGADLVDYTSYLAVTVIFYDLLVPIGRRLSLLAATFSVVGTAVVVVASLFYLMPVVSVAHSPDMTSLFLRLRTTGYSVSLVFFGLHLFLVGWLIARSIFLPRVLGATLVIGGLCYTCGGLANLLAPPVAASLSPYILAPGVIGSAVGFLWLLVAGVRPEKWRS
jgi:hypothetical protein